MIHSIIYYHLHYLRQITNQVLNTILHHPTLQDLESVWRSLWLLVENHRTSSQLKVKIFNLSQKQWLEDLQFCLTVEQSLLYQKIHQQEFDHPGGEPYALILAAYTINPHIQHMHLCKTILSIAEQSFCSFVFAASPKFLGVNNLYDLPVTTNFKRLLTLHEYQPWHELRQQHHAHYLAFVFAECLLRQPYKNQYCQEHILHLKERLWGNPVFLYGKKILEAYQSQPWLLPINTPPLASAAICNPLHSPTSYLFEKTYLRDGLARRLTPLEQQSLQDLGFLSISHNLHTALLDITQHHSIRQQNATSQCQANSNDLSQTLCLCRFIHAIKMMLRNKIGRFTHPEQCEHFLQTWLLQYSAQQESMSKQSISQYPLQHAKVMLEANASQPTVYQCIISLQLRSSTSGLQASFTLQTIIPLLLHDKG